MNKLNLKPIRSEKNITIKLKEEKIPDALIGKFYLRNGGNPYIISENNHIFDGDGMIHVIEFREKELQYHNRWIETYRYNLERKNNKEMFVRLGNLTSMEIFTKWVKRLFSFNDITDTINNKGDGTANTNIVYHAGKLLALNEMDKPYLLEIKDNKLVTIKRYDFEGRLSNNFNAHPKIDPETGEMVGLGYDILKKQCYINFINKMGILEKTIDIKLSGSNIIHDVGITKNNIIILDLPLEFSLKNVLLSQFPINVNKSNISKIGILDKKTYFLKWYKLKEHEIIFHIANCWERKNGKYIIIYAFCYDIENLNIKELHTQRPKLKRFVINTETKQIKKTIMSEYYGELPIIEDKSVGEKCEYIYYSKISDERFDGIIRHNVETGEEILIKFPNNMSGGESAIYENYIINLLYSVEENKSKLAIYDKNNLTLINLIDLKCRIPFGFHGRIIDLKNIKINN